MPYADKEYGRLKKREDYYANLETRRQSRREYYRQNKEAVNAKAKTRRQTFAGWLRSAISRAKARAAEAGIFFALVEQNISEPPLVCPILGLPMEYNSGKENACSLDRIDNTKGYVPNNVHIISDRANRLKRDASLDELILLGKWAQQIKEGLICNATNQ